ncbi:hypothetical protein WJ32_18590 (plasmid) [Burkholderia ubonensis]|uniref:Tetratricopeptide repeat protein n=1 Tax=Burkholderia ubonensis TaxID=101571 RepID=A0A103RNH9_9BURK|nr:tetratricopeptide repeat protein [Burkholderia ubonensis]AOJ64588.1 hypothetical protein WJ32_18590 [Burkholderia ubonensis]KVG71132.1 hypothetical protein WJ33_21310 [Burkholderia ubonensis]
MEDAVQRHTGSESEARLLRLVRFLDMDPQNPSLLAEAASVSFECSGFDRTVDWLKRLEKIQPLSPETLNMLGIAALASGQCAVAEEAFRDLRTQVPGDTTLLHEHAYTLILMGEYQKALDELDASEMPLPANCAALKTRALHHLGQVSAAIGYAEAALTDSSSDEDLAVSLATLYLDANRLDDAERLAQQFPSHYESAVILGSAHLLRGRQDEARASFDRALAIHQGSARALLGAGLTALSGLRFAEASSLLDDAARILDRHAGAWVAAGWSYLFAGDLKTARERFQRTNEIDKNFAEGHGGMAVVQRLEGEQREASRNAAIARRLDPDCFSLRLYATLIAEQQGDSQMSNDIRRSALEHQLLPDGTRIATLLTAYFPGFVDDDHRRTRH